MGEREAIRVEMNKLRKEAGIAKAKLTGVEQENSQLKKEMEELWAGFATLKKRDGGVIDWVCCSEEGIGSWVRHLEEETGDGV